MPNSDRPSSPAFWIITAALLFAIMAASARALGPRVDWLTIALVRTLFMFVASVAVTLASGTELVVWRPATLWMRSLSGSVSMVCLMYALTRLPLGDVLTLTNTYPLWIVVLSWLTMRRRPCAGDVLRVACGLAGVALIGQPHLTSSDRFATGLALFASVCSAVAMIGLHRLRDIDPRAVVAHFAGVASLFVAGWYLTRALAFGQRWVSLATATPTLAPVTILLLLSVGVTGTIGQIFLTRAYAAGPPARVSVLALTQVAFGLVFDVVFWQRDLPLSSLAGTALVLAPTAWILTRAATVAPPSPRHGAAPPSLPGLADDERPAQNAVAARTRNEDRR